MSAKQTASLGPHLNKLLKQAERMGCTWRKGSHLIQVYGPDGTWLCALPSSKTNNVGRYRRLKLILRRMENAK